MKKLVLLLSLFLSVSSFALVGGGYVAYFDDINFKQTGQDSYVLTSLNPPSFFHEVKLYNSEIYDPMKPSYQYKINNDEFLVEELSIKDNIITLVDKRNSIVLTIPAKKIIRNTANGEILELFAQESTDFEPSVPIFKNHGIDIGTSILLKTIDDNFNLTVTGLKKTREGLRVSCKKEKDKPFSCLIASGARFVMELTRK